MTNFIIASNAADYEVCQMLLDKHDLKRGPMTYPTVMAIRDDRLVGFVSTWPSEDAIVVGRSAIDVTPSQFLLKRLVEEYEKLLVSFGVTTYFIPIDVDQPHMWGQMEALLGEPHSVDNDLRWYKRNLVDAAG